MKSLLSEKLIPLLQERFPDRGLRLGTAPGPCAIFPAIHAVVGDIEIYDDGDELTAVLGNFTHCHFSNYENGLSLEQKAERIADDAAGFLVDLFANQIVVWGSHQGGGGFYRVGHGQGLGKDLERYVWSGPLNSAD